MDMDCKSSADLVTRILSGNSSSQDETQLRSHVAACPSCADVERKLARTWALMGRLQPIASRTAVPAAPRATVLRSPLWRIAVSAAAVLVVAAVAFSLFKPESPRPVTPVVQQNPADEGRPEDHEEANRLQGVLQRIEIENPAPAPAPDRSKDEVVVEPVVAPNPDQKPDPKPPVPVTPTPKDPVAKEPVPPTRPEEKPAPEVRPVPAPAPAVAIAKVDRVEGDVFARTASGRSAVQSGHGLFAGDGLETAGKTGQAVVEFADGTRLVLGADTIVDSIRLAEGKRVSLKQGVLAAQISKQPAEFPMVFMTASAEARALSSRLTLSVAPSSTRLEVREGKVRATRKDDDASVDISADHFVVIGKGLSMTPKPVTTVRIALHETFDRARLTGTWNQGGEANLGVRIASENGSLSIKTAQKPAQDFGTPGKMPSEKAEAVGKMVQGIAGLARKDWPRLGWIETRQAFPFSNDNPLKIRTRSWNSHNNADRITWLALNRGVAGQGLSLERRGGSLQLWVEGANAPVWKEDVAAAQEWETLELWLSKDKMVVRRNERTLYTGANPLKVKAGSLSLGILAKMELPQDEEVRFDDVDAILTTKAELAEVAR